MTTNSTSYLNRTQSSSTSDKIGTFSAWIKGMVAGETNSIFTGYTDNNNKIYLYLSDRLQVYGATSGSQSVYLQTTAKFRDPSAYYHVVVAWDTTQGTASNRFKIYVNGEQITAFDTASYPSQNSDVYWNKGTTSLVGARYVSSIVNYFYGYMSHVAFVDGQQLAPTVFGETDSTSGIWKFKGPSGVTWGNNGFHLKFENSGNLGLDSSGNSNTFTVNGNGRQSIDTPSIVYCTGNAIGGRKNQPTLSHGNLTTTGTGGGTTWNCLIGTFGTTKGKWYYEYKITGSQQVQDFMLGILNTEVANSATVNTHQQNGTCLFYPNDGGEIHMDNSATTNDYGTSAQNDIFGIAYDLDTYKFNVYKNGTQIVTNFALSSNFQQGQTIVPSINLYEQNVGSINFGNGFFGTTAISSAGSNGNGSLFEYDVPSGYYALNTKNINTYG